MHDDYEVGYGKPPVNTRFKKGQSGNPFGGKPGRQTKRQLFDKLLHEVVTVTEQGQKKRMTKLQLVLSQLINKAASGDAKSMRVFLDVLDRHPMEPETFRIDREDQKWLGEFLMEAKEADDRY